MKLFAPMRVRCVDASDTQGILERGASYVVDAVSLSVHNEALVHLEGRPPNQYWRETRFKRVVRVKLRVAYVGATITRAPNQERANDDTQDRAVNG